jgi:hypothetical protein
VAIVPSSMTSNALISPTLYDTLLKEYEGQEDSKYHADLDFEPVAPTMVGKQWLVVVDYHC